MELWQRNLEQLHGRHHRGNNDRVLELRQFLEFKQFLELRQFLELLQFVKTGRSVKLFKTRQLRRQLPQRKTINAIIGFLNR